MSIYLHSFFLLLEQVNFTSLADLHDVKESFKGGSIVNWTLHNVGDIDEDNFDELLDLLPKLPNIVDLYYSMVAEIEELLESVDAITK